MRSDDLASLDCHRRMVHVGSDFGFALLLLKRRGGRGHWWVCTMYDVRIAVSQEVLITCIMRSHRCASQNMRGLAAF